MRNDKVDTLEMIRKIRDTNYTRLKNKSFQERIDFYREKTVLLKKPKEINA